MKVLGVVMTVAMLASFMVAGAPVTAAGSATVINEWEKLSMPSLAPGTDVDLIEQANDGTIFISVLDDGADNIVGTDDDRWAMYKSTDGYNWTLTNINNKTTRITAIEPSANYAVDKTVYVAVDTSLTAADPALQFGYTTLYRCTNGAAVGTPIGEMGMISSGMGGTLNAGYIYSLDSYYDGSYVWLLAATDIDAFAIRDDKGLTTVWTDMQLSETLGGEYSDMVLPAVGVEVYKAMFAADYASTGVIWAVYYDEYESPALASRFAAAIIDNKDGSNGYGIIARSSGSTLWGTVITPVIIWDEVSSGTAKWQCDLEFSAAYSSTSNPELYAALSFWGDTDYDDIYRIECGFYGAAGNVTPFDVDPANIDFCSIEVDGSNIIVGSYDMSASPDAAQVWYSHNDGTTWAMSARNPTGQASETCNLLISKYGSTDGLAFAATGGTQSAVSISDDMGYTWAQTGFIDDDIATIVDIAFHPTTKAALLVTSNTSSDVEYTDDSLWITSDVTTPAVNWKRIFCENYNTNINFNMVEYSADGAAVMVYDEWADVIFRSTDNANTFGNWRNTTSWGDINAWLIPNASTVYAATGNGFWSTALVGSRLADTILVSIAGYGDTLAVGDAGGNVYISLNKGNVWGAGNPLGTAANAYVAFDSKGVLYMANDVNVFYVALTSGGAFATGGVEDYGATPTAVDALVGIQVSADDTLFVLDGDGDAARYLLYDIPTEWDQVENSDGAVSTDELWITEGSHTAWTIDNGNVAIWLLDDTLSGAVTGITVTNIDAFSATISWNNMTGAEVYEIILDEYLYLGTPSSPVSVFVPAQPGAKTTIHTSMLEPYIPFLWDATEYDVLVRVNNDEDLDIDEEIELSRWGATSFMTKYYMDTPKPTNPVQGTDGTTLNPTFGWSSVPNAVSYTFQLSDKPDFSTLIDTASINVTGYTYGGDALEYQSAYYWRVKAIGPDGTESKWSTYTPAYMSITLEEFMAGWNVDDVMGFFRNGDMVFYWITGAISSFNTIQDPEGYQSELTVTQTETTVISTVTQINPTYTIPVPEFTVTVPAPPASTVTTITNVVEIPDQETPVYIWAIVAIGALLTIAVIVLIIRTRRVV